VLDFVRIATEITHDRGNTFNITIHTENVERPCRPPSSVVGMSKRIHIYTDEDVSSHCTSTSCWVSRKGKVYDVTKFLDDHPGGDDLILKYAGKDIDEVMKDPAEHEHSDSAYDMMDEFLIGRLGQGEKTVSDGRSFPALHPRSG
jgi:cytochrome b involved in lipid metabolism